MPVCDEGNKENSGAFFSLVLERDKGRDKRDLEARTRSEGNIFIAC